jgi:hypothetical protein
MDLWAIHGTVHSVTDCRQCTKFSICYLNANVSTPGFTSNPIIMCNKHGVSSENLFMQAQ